MDNLNLELTVGDKVFPMSIKIGKSMLDFNDDLLEKFQIMIRDIIAVRKFGIRYDNLSDEQLDQVEEIVDKAQDGKEEI